jgi:bifunctional UDP-N-acetylglucosamine pyrophosphorylase / glucosamine-1-phosphate N-acetyltransferase
MTTMPARSLAVVFSASAANRMNGAQPKVMHELCGRPMIHFVVASALDAGIDHVVVVVEAGGEKVAAFLAQTFADSVTSVIEGETSREFVLNALAQQGQDGLCFVLRGDTPLLESDDLERLASGGLIPSVDLAVLMNGETAGPWVCRSSVLRKTLASTGRDSLTKASEFGSLGVPPDRSARVPARDESTLESVDDRVQLAVAEDRLYARIADELRLAGATIRGSARIDVGVVVEPDATIEDGVRLRGKTRIAAGARVDVGCVLTDMNVAANVVIKPYSVCTQSRIRELAEVGPFSHVRGDSDIHEDARIGNFVETKNVVVGRRAMANHLAYLGDGVMGERSNIGAGTIFCNSDGVNKFRTEVGKGAFVGSACQLVAPVRVGDGAFVATGTTVTQDVPEDAMAIARVPQQNKEGYAKQLRANFAAIKAKLLSKKE